MRLAATVTLLLVAVTCGRGTPEVRETSTPETPASQIRVTLTEFSVIPTPAVGIPGEIAFAVTNRGALTHEFVVARSDLPPGALPTLDDGSVNEPLVDVAGEVEELASGGSGSVTLDLAAGKYVLFCNVVDPPTEGQVASHYRRGMRTGFTVP